jgi:hypothetical protein
MQTSQSFFQSELERLINDQINRLRDQLVTAHTTIDYSAYKHQVGKIEGLQSALELIDEAWSVVNATK